MKRLEMLNNQGEQLNKNNPWRPALQYTFFGFLWILFSDTLLGWFVKDPQLYKNIQTVKGWLFILLTTGLLYLLIKFDNRKIYRLTEDINAMNLELQAYAEETSAMDLELQDQLERLNHMVYYDQLTGLKNRFFFEEDIERYLKKGDSFNVYYVDVDHFKNLNDIHGHYLGDEFLKVFGDTLAHDYGELEIYRWGGDEFVIIDHYNKEAAMVDAVQRILHDTHRTWKVKEVEFHTSTSIGVVTCPDQGEDISTIFKNLEVALYKAKESGRARCAFFDQSYSDAIQRKSKIEGLINRALEEDGFYLNYQPIYDLKTRKPYRYEVLLRVSIDNDLKTNIGEVISVAEQTGQIHRIDDWVIEKVFSKMEHHRHRMPGFKVAVNISAQTFTSMPFINNLKSLIRKYDIDPGNIELEVTEHTIIKNIDESYDIMKGIKGLGFMMALDDFGTRYSSLNYLSRLPFDILKVDKSYVDNIMKESNDVTIVKQIITLAKAIGLTTVAEGIETAEQEKVLLDAGCDFGQGYHFSRPQGFDQIVELYGE